MIEEREEIASQLQNVRLEIVTAQKDIDALNSEILFAENSSNNFGERQRELNAQIEDYKNKNALIQKKDADDLDFSSVFYFNIVMAFKCMTMRFYLSRE